MRQIKIIASVVNSNFAKHFVRLEAGGCTDMAFSIKRTLFPIGASRRLVYFVAATMAASVVTQARCGTDFLSAKPTVRTEYWQRRQTEITSYLNEGKNLSSVKLVFLGDSITDFWIMGDNPWATGAKMGREIWNESFCGRPPENLALNLGISGDRTEHVLYRLLPQSAGGLGELDAPGLNPEFVIVLVGINNTWAAEEPVVESVFEGIRAVVSAVHDRKPKATVILQSLLPTQDESKNRDVLRPVNQRLMDLSSRLPFSAYIIYVDLYSAFVDFSGRQLTLYFVEGVHPNESGYRVWRDRLVPLLNRVRASVDAKPVRR